MFGASVFVLCAVWAVFKEPTSKFQLMPVWGHLWATCRRVMPLSGVRLSRQLESFSGAKFGHCCIFGATFRHFLQQSWLFVDNLCSFQTICSDSTKLRNRQALSAMANLGQYSGILCESWSQLSTFRQSSDNISPSGLLCEKFLVQLVSAPSKQEGTR